MLFHNRALNIYIRLFEYVIQTPQMTFSVTEFCIKKVFIFHNLTLHYIFK